MPVTAANVIAGTLRRAGIPNADVHAKAIAADLAGHSLLADSPTPRRTKATADAPKQKCRNPQDPHWMTDLVGDRCPTCGWSPNDNPTTTGA